MYFNNSELMDSSENIPFRIDQNGKYYTGVLCGLGWNPTTGASILPEHDMELAFDVQLSVEDVVEVRVAQHHGATTLSFSGFAHLTVSAESAVELAVQTHASGPGDVHIPCPSWGRLPGGPLLHLPI